MNISKEEHQKLFTELEERIARRPLLNERIANAIQKDMRVNDQLDRETRTFEQNEERIRRLEEILANSVIIDEIKELDRVVVGARVTVIREKKEIEFHILDENSPAINPLVGRISSNTAVSKALLGRVVDDIVEVDVPAGKFKLRIVKIIY